MSTAVISTAIFMCPGRAGPVFRLDPLFGIIPVVTLFVVCAGAVVSINFTYLRLCTDVTRK